MQDKSDQWLAWFRRLQSISRTGLSFSRNPFDLERFEEILGIACAMMGDCAGRDPDAIREIILEDNGYVTPKVGVRAAVFHNDRILMVRERSNQLWTLPGGYADVSQSPKEAAVAEVLQESGFLCRAVKLCGVYDSLTRKCSPHIFQFYTLHFLCELTGGSAKESIETDGVEFFSQGEIPSLCPIRASQWQIERMFAHHKDPSLPTDFD